jgi:uncharacterized protein (DUF934 family)
MTDLASAPSARLWTRDGFRPDSWRHTDSADDLSRNSGLILPLAAYLALDPSVRDTHKDRLGVLLMPADPVEAIVPFLPQLALVALAFPAFNDGRSYSKAALLRTRHDYRGVVRAAGDVLIDQIPLMLRTGFDEFEVSNPTALKRLEEGRLGGLPQHYQPASDKAEAGERYSWRRLPS